MRAAQFGGQVLTANFAVLNAREDTVQARAAAKPSVSALNRYIGTQDNGTSTGVFIGNNGPNEFIEQATVHQEVLSLARHGEIQRAQAAEAVAKARLDVAARGLKSTVVQDYYAIVSAQRLVRNAQTSVTEAQRFVDISQQLQKGGEAAQADVIKAQISLQARQRDLQDAQTSLERAKIALGVLIFPTFTGDFNVTDDLQQLMMPPTLGEAQSQASSSSPDLHAASASIQEAGLGIKVARYAYLPSLGLDAFYGFDSNRLKLHAVEEGEVRRNIGASVAVTMDIPIWNWGQTRSKIRQAEIKRDQAKVELSLAERTLQSSLADLYAEARGAFAQLDSLRSSNDLSAESLRLTQLRYQAGEANALEVVDAQTTAAQARNAYDQGLARYRVALDSLKVLMGTL